MGRKKKSSTIQRESREKLGELLDGCSGTLFLDNSKDFTKVLDRANIEIVGETAFYYIKSIRIMFVESGLNIENQTVIKL